jgi:hypothetical protein
MGKNLRGAFFAFFQGIFISVLEKGVTMKTMFFRNLTRGFVIAGAVMALVNCDSSTAANDNQNTTDPTAVTPTDNPANPGDPTNPVNNPVIDPATGLPVDPALNPTDPAQQ